VFWKLKNGPFANKLDLTSDCMLFGLDPDMEEIGKMASFQNLESFSEFFLQEFTQEESNFSFL
jgi:hypothetical protein